MIRPTSLVLMALAAATGGALFHVSFAVSELDDRLAVLNEEIRDDREAIHVLRAEWSFLNQPGRLEELARRHLDLVPVAGVQMTAAGTLPVRPDELPGSLADNAPMTLQAVMTFDGKDRRRASRLAPARAIEAAVNAATPAAEPHVPAPVAAPAIQPAVQPAVETVVHTLAQPAVHRAVETEPAATRTLDDLLREITAPGSPQ